MNTAISDAGRGTGTSPSPPSSNRDISTVAAQPSEHGTDTSPSSTHDGKWQGRRPQHHPLLDAALPPAVSIGVLLVVWECSVRFGLVSERTLASPTQMVVSMVNTWPQLMAATAVTTYETVTGFLIAIVAGILIGIGMYRSVLMHRALYPLLVAAQTIPLIAIAPLFMLWFGFDSTGKIVLVAVLAVFPIAIQTCRGLFAVPQFYEDVALTCGATPRWTLWHVKLRVAGRQIFGGIRISAAYVCGTAVTAEYLGARNGLGIWLQAAFNSFRTPPIFAAALIIILETGVLLGLVSLAEYALLGADERQSTAPPLRRTV